MEQEQNMNLQELLTKNVEDLTIEELDFIVNYEAKMRAVRKVAVAKGVMEKKVAKKELSPEVQILADGFKVLIEINLETIRGLFPAETDKPKGQKGVTLPTPKDCPFYVQLLNKAAFTYAVEQNKKEKADKKAAMEAMKEQITEKLAEVTAEEAQKAKMETTL